jgi:hypothetical protein
MYEYINMNINIFIGLTEDLWSTIYPSDLEAESAESFISLLSRLFPQFKALFIKLNAKLETDDDLNRGEKGVRDMGVLDKAESMTAVKYFSHKKCPTFNHPPVPPDNPVCYRTVGVVSQPASDLLARYVDLYAYLDINFIHIERILTSIFI